MRTYNLIYYSLASVLMGVLFSSCSPYEMTKKIQQPANQIVQSSSRNDHYNIVWIILDGCQAKHLSCYGYKRKTSPNIDKLARESILFRQAIAQSTVTNISFASFLTGQYPSALGFYDLEFTLDNTALTLPEILRIYGYTTASFNTGPLTLPIYGLNQGFETYHHSLLKKKGASSFKMSLRYLMPDASQWLTQHQSDKFFIVLHGNDTHFPFDVDPAYHHLYDPDYRGIIDYFITNQKIFEKDMTFFEAGQLD